MKMYRALAIGLGFLFEAGWNLAQEAPAAELRGPSPARNVNFRPSIPTASGTGSISGICFEDANGNGLLDAGERPFPGLSVLLEFDVPPPLLPAIYATAVSRADGTFEFHDVPFGKYVVAVPEPEGYRSTDPRPRVSLDDAHRVISGLLFGNVPAGGVVGGTSFRDLDGNGLRDAGEPGAPGVTIELRLPTGQLVASAQTDSSGNFLFGRELAGSYELTQDLSNGLVQTTPAGDGALALTVKDGSGSSGLVLGNQEATGSISGTVFDDRNSSGARDSGEGGVPGVAVSLIDPFGIRHRTVTDASGLFSFTSLPAAGAYRLSETLPPGALETASPGSAALTIPESGSLTDLLFGLYRPFAGNAAPSVSGSVFLDRNGNGLIDGLDRPLSGIPMVLTGSAGAATTAVATADGTFRFDNLAPGNYVLSESVPVGFTLTFPGSPGGSHSYSLTLFQGDRRDGLLFLNR